MKHNTKIFHQFKRCHRAPLGLASVCIISIIGVTLVIDQLCLAATSQDNHSSSGTQPISSRLAFLRAQRAAAASRQSPPQQTTPKNETTTLKPTASESTSTTSATLASTTSTTTTTPTTVAATTSRGVATKLSLNEALKPAVNQHQAAAQSTTSASVLAPPKNVAHQPNNANNGGASNNRSTRTAGAFQDGDGYNVVVTNNCEEEQMLVNIRTSKPFYGVIHTRDQRQKEVCTIEGDGGQVYDLRISHILDSQDPEYCGVIRAPKESPEDRNLLSVVLAVRFHRKIELSDDKFFLLNCTNRCRRPDCSTGGQRDSLGKLIEETTTRPADGNSLLNPGSQDGNSECTVWNFPWLITLLWCMGIMLVAMIISHCIMCSSLVCKCVKTEVEEREPSVYEGATDIDDEDSLYNRKTHPMRIDYDNRDIYKTSNNYEPYRLERDDENCEDDADRRRGGNNKRRNRNK